MQVRTAFRVAAFVVAGAIYILGSHWVMTGNAPSSWRVVGVFAPMLLAVAWGARRGAQDGLALLCVLALAALVAMAVFHIPLDAQRLFLAQHVGIQLALAIGFGTTLRAGRTPLISALARRVHREFPPAMARYTRQVTGAWTLYFLAMAVASVALFVLGPFERWAQFANLVTPLSIVAMFGVEYLLRYRLHPEFERASVIDAVRSYVRHAQDPAA